MELIILENEMPVFNPEARLIKEFAKIIARSRPVGMSHEDGNKEAALRLAFLFFMADWKSRYVTEYQDNTERANKVKHDLGLGDNFDVSDDHVIEALYKYTELNTTEAAETLISAKNAIWKLREYYDSVNFVDKDEKGRLKFDPKQVQESIGKLGITIVGLEALEKEVRKREEQSTKGKIKGGGESGYFEDPEPADMKVSS